MQKIYGEQSALVVAFFGKDYANKPWCSRAEWPTIRNALMFGGHDDDYLMVMRFDNTPIEGFLRIHGSSYIGDCSPRATADLVLQRAKGNRAPQPAQGNLCPGFPTSIDEDFLGRDDALARLHKSLQAGGATAVTQAIVGLGGIGKSRLAVEYARQHSDDYTYLFNVRARFEARPETASDAEETFISPSIDSGLAELAGRLPELRSLRGRPQVEQIQTLFERLASCLKPWLLILDNIDAEADAVALVENLWRFEGGRLLVTARWGNWGRGVQALPLDTISLAAARDLLLRLSENRDSGDDDEERAQELAVLLSGLSAADRERLSEEGPDSVIGGLPLVLE